MSVSPHTPPKQSSCRKLFSPKKVEFSVGKLNLTRFSIYRYFCLLIPELGLITELFVQIIPQTPHNLGQTFPITVVATFCIYRLK